MTTLPTQQEVREILKGLREIHEGSWSDESLPALNSAISIAQAYAEGKLGEVMTEDELKDKLDEIYKAWDGEGLWHRVIAHALAGHIPAEGMLPKVNGEYQCEHVQKDCIDADCVWCNLTIAEQSLEVLRKKVEELKKRLSDPKHTANTLAIVQFVEACGGLEKLKHALTGRVEKKEEPKQEKVEELPELKDMISYPTMCDSMVKSLLTLINNNKDKLNETIRTINSHSDRIERLEEG